MTTRPVWRFVWVAGFAAALFAAKTASHSVAGQEDAANKSEVLVVVGPSAWTDESMRETPDVEVPVVTGALAPDSPANGSEDFRTAQAVDKEDTGYAVASSGDFKAIPFRYSGKLFFGKADGTKARCSAQFIAPHILLTAAHCVRDSENGRWNQNFVFALQYFNGEYSKKYAVQCAFTNTGWLDVNHEKKLRVHYDYALLITSEDTATGHFGWSIGWRGRYASAVKIGYPRDIEEGKVIQVENGPLFFPNDRPGAVAIRHSNPKSGKGSSGGAFVANFDPLGRPGGNTIISLTSASYGSDVNTDLGPYLDQDFQTLFTRASQGCR